MKKRFRKDLVDRVFSVVSTIPKGKVITYLEVSKQAGIHNPRLVGSILHTNTDTKNVPCHRVVKSDMTLADGYKFGGKSAQKKRLESEGVQFSRGKIIIIK